MRRSPPGGYFGKVLIVDLSIGSGRTAPLDESVLRSYIGGAGLGTWLMHRYCPAGIDPLDPRAPLAFVFSPLVGTPLTTSAKFAVVGKSPLTGRLTDALASSHFAIAGKLSGHDAIVIHGACEQPSVLVIDQGEVSLAPAGDLWGSSAEHTETTLRERMGPAWRVASIGPAGERGVRYATISHDGRHAGRGGLGTVMGSKLCKAIVVRGRGKVASADPAGVLAAAKDLRERSFGPATAKYRELGTMSNLLTFNAISTLPTRNFSAARFEGAPALDVGEVSALKQVARNSCASCSIGCEHLVKGPGGKKTRMEYENLFALGPLCGVSDAEAVVAASSLCDELGLDTISTGGTIAWAMECAERGLIDAPWLRFGDADALLRAIEEIGAREGIGDLLADGSRAAARMVGEGSEAFAAHVKGLELPGYEPRTLQSMALGLAVNARGADHNRSGAYEADLSGDHDRLNGGESHVAGAIDTENRAAIMDSLILCKFLRGVFADPYPDWASLLNLITGWDVDADELERTAQRIVLAKRMFNLREGWTRAEDWLPDRFLSESLELESGRKATLTADRLDAMISSYYRGRGLEPSGVPRPSTVDELELHALTGDLDK
jgi:aldehyde:ferredoxin oxidoreductase